ncbi:MgtC/SapB family protein [Chitinophaga vietnamensis]|uniref:MgtC/SapB family protein n=1 Tax=Chitinophaga vietnamensis TaxID=2593957 RepID=UPI001178C1F3|nr:MgtC/SapB family protein [Chitinophaga vietnamensis]
MLSPLTFAARLGIAFILGAVIGMERQYRQRMAGLRTNMLVALGASMFVGISMHLSPEAAGRVTSYVVSGIGFLGAGVIMKDGLNVKGLNTAATLWCSAAVGAACGLGLLAEACIGAVFILGTHLLMRPLGVRLGNLPINRKLSAQIGYILVIKCKQQVENHLRVLLLQAANADHKLLLRSLRSSDNGDPANAIITAEILSNGNEDSNMEKMAARLTIEQDVTEVSWNRMASEYDL